MPGDIVIGFCPTIPAKLSKKKNNNNNNNNMIKITDNYKLIKIPPTVE